MQDFFSLFIKKPPNNHPEHHSNNLATLSITHNTLCGNEFYKHQVHFKSSYKNLIYY